MSDMVPTGSKYTDQDRLNAINAYGIYGTFMAVERELGIPNNTVCNWAQCDWWLEGVAKVRAANQEQHIAQYTQLTAKALSKANVAIDQLGDNLSASDIKALVVTGATATDKARLLLNLPTSVSSKDAGISELKAQFEALSTRHKAIESTIVSEQGDSEGSQE